MQVRSVQGFLLPKRSALLWSFNFLVPSVQSEPISAVRLGEGIFYLKTILKWFLKWSLFLVILSYLSEETIKNSYFQLYSNNGLVLKAALDTFSISYRNITTLFMQQKPLFCSVVKTQAFSVFTCKLCLELWPVPLNENRPVDWKERAEDFLKATGQCSPC